MACPESGSAYDDDWYGLECARCGRVVGVAADEVPERERDAFCGECASECVDYDD